LFEKEKIPNKYYNDGTYLNVKLVAAKIES